MFSLRRTAQFGLGAAFIVLIGCMSVLFARSAQTQDFRPTRVGVSATQFTLNDSAGKSFTLTPGDDTITILYFNSLNCRVCNEYNGRIAGLVARYQSTPRVRFIAINSDPNRDLQEIRVQQRVQGLLYPTLIDEGLKVTGLYDVRLTPSFCLIDEQGIIRYRGSLDDNRDASKATQPYLDRAIQSVLAGDVVETELTHAFGCAIEQPK